MRSDAARRGLVLAALLALWPAPGFGQTVVFTGRGDVDLDPRLERFLARRDYLLVTRDTLIAASDSVPRSVLVAGATFTLEGAVAGDLVAVDANVFLRPSARVHGDVVNLGGGLYPSALARVGGVVVDEPLAPYSIVVDGDEVRIRGEAVSSVVELGGVYGFEPPTYDRVDAVGLRWGAGLRLPPVGTVRPRLGGWIGYASGRGALNGGLGLEARHGRTRVALGAEERTATRDAWIRGDLRNSLAFAVKGNDQRNYYEAEVGYAEVARELGRYGLSGAAQVRAQLERGKSLGAGSPWVLLDGDEIRPNPPIDDGTIASLILGLDGSWIGRFAALQAGVEVEIAETVLGGDFRFGSFLAHGAWGMDALANHMLRVEWRFQGPLPGTTSLPRQRWSFVGGSGTLPTFGTARFRGDRLVFVETKYIVPLPQRVAVPIVGPPDLMFVHTFGMAWTEGDRRDLEQNLEIRLEFFAPYVRVVTNPADPWDSIELDLGVSWPFDNERPWRRP